MDSNSSSSQSNLQLIISNLQSLDTVLDRLTNEYKLKNQILKDGVDKYNKLAANLGQK